MKKIIIFVALSFAILPVSYAQKPESIFLQNEDAAEQSLFLNALTMESQYIHRFMQRAEYCSNIGEPIYKYTKAYQEDNKKIHTIILSILSKNWNPSYGEFTEEKLFNRVGKITMSSMEKQMKDLADKSKISEKDVCKWFDANVEETVKSRNLVLNDPERSKIILNSSYGK